MDFISGKQKRECVSYNQILSEDCIGRQVKTNGMIHSVRDMKDMTFLILRKAEGLLQCVYMKNSDSSLDLASVLKEIKEESSVEISGTINKEERAPLGVEMRICDIRVLSRPLSALPVSVNKRKLTSSLETTLHYRPITLRHVKERARFKIQEGLVRGFRDFLSGEGFTEIRTPKLVARGAEGGANIFKLDYFEQMAELAQSPQFYKQMLVGVYDRVFEVGPVFRAEKHNTTRHLNEYTSLDFEMAYIDSFTDIMNMETAMLQYTFGFLNEKYQKEFTLLDVTLPTLPEIPSVRFSDAKHLVAEKYKRKIKTPYDLEPEEEQLIGAYFQEEYGSDFVFVTHYPTKKRPFYAMDDPSDKKFTLSFDLLYKGLEITTGGQRIHDYQMLVEKIEQRGLDPKDIESYVSVFQYGMPPHGGLGIGLERLAMKLLDATNVRETSLFPRDINRLEP